jgi:hypothetical protein
MQLVPFDHWNDAVPCRHIPLNERGETIESCYHWGTQEEIETVFSTWLTTTIHKLERSVSAASDGSKVDAAIAGSLH